MIGEKPIRIFRDIEDGIFASATALRFHPETFRLLLMMTSTEDTLNGMAPRPMLGGVECLIDAYMPEGKVAVIVGRDVVAVLDV